MPFINITNLNFSYPQPGNAAVSRPALSGVALSIEKGEYVALIGSNGSGKTTLALHLNGLLLPSEGTVQVAGLDTRTPANLPLIRRQVAMVFQRPEEQIVAITVEEDTAFGPENLGLPRDEIRRRVDDALKRVKLWELRTRSPHELSAGQKQRLAIAGVLALEPGCIVFDEATAMLDPVGRRSVMGLIRDLTASGLTIVHITHHMEEAAEAGRLVVLSQGQIVRDGAPAEVLASPELHGWGLKRPAALELSMRLSDRHGIAVGAHLDFESLGSELLRQVPAAGSLGGGNGRAHPARFDVRAGEHGARAEMGRDSKPTHASSHAPGEVPAAGAPFIALRSVSHWYRSSGNRKSAPDSGIPSLRAVSLTVGRGECIALVGATGSGKSTLLQHLNCLFLPQQGEIEIEGRKVVDEARALSAIRRRIGLAFQRPEEQLFEQYVGDDVAYGPRLAGLSGKELTARVRWAMECVGLPFDAFKDRLSFSLSGGEQRKAGLAGVLALKPAVLLLDEPTAGLDPVARDETIALLDRMAAEGTTLVLSTHDMELAAQLSSRTIALSEGTIVHDESTERFFGRSEELRAIDLDVPGFVELEDRLKRAGIELDARALTLDEAEEALARYFGAKAGRREQNAAV